LLEESLQRGVGVRERGRCEEDDGEEGLLQHGSSFVHRMGR
jgi:hypothetical protein